MQIGKVKRRDKIKLAKKIASKPIEFVRNYKRTRKNRAVMISVLFIVSFLSLANVKTFVQNSFSGYYVNADSPKTAEQDIIPPIITTDSTTIKSNSDTFSSQSNATFIDKRAYVLNLYLATNNSPLAGYGQDFVTACDKYGAPHECITAVAIAFNETHLCKYPGSAAMFNCWGFGGGGENRIAFSSFHQSIDRVTQVLAQQYGAKYMQDPSQMERTFCGWEPGCTGWGNKIKFFMQDIRNFSSGLGIDMSK